MDQIICHNKRDTSPTPTGYRRIDVTSHARDIFRSCSPFLCGPCPLYGDYVAKNVENGWQYAKVYRQFADENKDPTPEYFKWAQEGWNNSVATRRPMGYRTPLYSYWDGEKLGYIEARAKIYVPLYTKAVEHTEGFQELKRLYERGDKLCLLDYDGYDVQNKSFEDVLNDPIEPLGHSLVLKYMLDGFIHAKHPPFRVIIAGSRDFDDYERLRAYADKALEAVRKERTVEIVCGCARGADSLGKQYAQERGFGVKDMPADWDGLGKVAGYRRNEAMADYADALIAFWDGTSRGTKHMITTMKERGKSVRVCLYTKTER